MTLQEATSRCSEMIKPDFKWNLSDNDKEAIRIVLDAEKEARIRNIGREQRQNILV